MRNRNKIALNTVLIAALLGIWGWIIRSAFEKEAPMPPIQAEALNAGQKKAADKQSYALKLDYADPFLKHVQRSRAQTPVANPSPPVAERPPLAPSKTPWPDIRYFGLIRNNTRGRKLGLLTIGEQSHLISTDTHLGDIAIRSYNADSAILAFQDEIRTYKIITQH